MIGMLMDTGIVIHDLLTYSDTPYEGLNRFIEFSSLAMMIISAAAILIFIAVNPKLRRRERYLDHETGFFNRDYLGCLSKYRDKKEYTGGNGILIDAKGHRRDMATLLEELKPFDSNIFALGEDRFLLLSESLRGSAVNMAVNTITDAAEKEKEPYTPGIKTIERGSKESAEAFAERLLKSA